MHGLHAWKSETQKSTLKLHWAGRWIEGVICSPRISLLPPSGGLRQNLPQSWFAVVDSVFLLLSLRIRSNSLTDSKCEFKTSSTDRRLACESCYKSHKQFWQQTDPICATWLFVSLWPYSVHSLVWNVYYFYVVAQIGWLLSCSTNRVCYLIHDQLVSSHDNSLEYIERVVKKKKGRF